MQKIGITLGLILILFSASIAYGASDKVYNVAELVEGLHTYDGQMVTLHVEAIGDKMIRGDEMVFNGLDATGAIGFWAPSSLSDTIENLGSYNRVGDILEIKGIYHLNCKVHGGDTDIHVESIVCIEKGHSVSHPITESKLIVLSVSSLGLLGLLTVYFLTKKRAFTP